MSIRRRVRAFAVVACAAIAATPAAQDRPTFRGGTNVVRVDLFATRDGKVVDDLKAAELEILEDGVKQTIDSFERIVVRPPVAQELRAEPNSVAESRQMAADPRARIFVMFLDTYHTDFSNSARMRKALLQFVDRVVGQDDLVGLMTPEMSATDVTLARRTTVVSTLLNENSWGRRQRLTDNDPIEEMYEACFTLEDPKIAPEMKARRREKLSLDALDDLMVHLGGLREERKAVLAVSEGWLQYIPNPQLARLLKTDEGRIPLPPGIVDRGAGRSGDRTIGGIDRDRCNADRTALASLDHSNRLQEMTERANRVNVTFYPVGAQGLAVFDSDIGPEPPLPPAQDSANLRNRINGLRLLAEQTDGVAIVNTNNVDQLLRRVVDDLSSYYLATYSSTNTRLDGRYRRITVRVTRPGVDTRARRGYRALTAGELAPGTSTAAGAAAPMSPSASGVLAALTAMAFNPRAEMRLRTSAWAPAAGQGAFWLVGTLDDATKRGAEWSAGGTAEVSVRGDDGRTVLTKTVPIGSDGGFSVQVPEAGVLPPGDYAIRVRARGGAGATLDETARASVPVQAAMLGDPVVWRRRPATGPAFLRSADPRASRTDRLRFELAAPAAGEATATLLDRTGKPIAIPLQVATREDGGVRWITVETALAPLAPGDYAVEVKVGEASRTTAFRVVP